MANVNYLEEPIIKLRTNYKVTCEIRILLNYLEEPMLIIWKNQLFEYSNIIVNYLEEPIIKLFYKGTWLIIWKNQL